MLYYRILSEEFEKIKIEYGITDSDITPVRNVSSIEDCMPGLSLLWPALQQLAVDDGIYIILYIMFTNNSNID